LWIASLIFGVIGLSPKTMNWAVPLAGVTFGLGFIAAGLILYSERAGDAP
jgi:hypothetical protein